MVGGGKALCFLLYMVSHKIRFVRRSCQLCVVIISIPSGPCILYEMERCIQTQQVNGTNTASEWNKYHCIRVTCHISKQNTAGNTTICVHKNCYITQCPTPYLLITVAILTSNSYTDALVSLFKSS